MKQSTQLIVEQFPVLRDQLIKNESVILTDQVLSNLNQVESVFLRLAWFFENPNEQNFNLETLYKELDNDWLEMALEAIYIFFREDTYLISEPTHSIITEGDYYMNQSRFADFLQENGLNYDRSKLNVYLQRGIVPEPDITISGTEYWEKRNCERFLEEQLQKGKK